MVRSNQLALKHLRWGNEKKSGANIAKILKRRIFGKRGNGNAQISIDSIPLIESVEKCLKDRQLLLMV